MNLSLYKTSKNESFFKVLVWLFFSRVFYETRIPYSMSFKRAVLRAFGSNIGNNVVIKPSVKIKYPWRLKVGQNCWLGEHVWIDNVFDVTIKDNTCISQGAYLLTGNHDFRSNTFDLTGGVITIEEQCWIGAKVIICPGVIMKKGTVVAVGSVLTLGTTENSIYQGNPAKYKKERYK